MAALGNQNAAKGKRWAAAIERALERRATGKPLPDDVSDLIRGLDLAAEQFVDAMFADKELARFKEFGDRMDGKSAQSLAVTGEDGGPLKTSLAIEFVRPAT